jgi:RHS repeat-associated protein
MPENRSQAGSKNGVSPTQEGIKPPSISLPKGGGAIRGIGEKFAANPVTGTGSMTLPIATSPGRSGFGPQLSLSYDSGAGNGPFGFGWSLSLPSITRKTDKGLPKYQDADESDVFILSGAEDLVPVLVQNDGRRETNERKVGGRTYGVQRYRPRTEGLFARIERWTNLADPGETFWRSISRDNVTTWYGKSAKSRIADPTRIFSWLICESYDDKGNLIVYGYQGENSDAIDLSQAHERNRTEQTRAANRYLKRIKYGNRTPYYPILGENQPHTPLPSEWLFEVVFDYGDHDPDVPMPEEPGKHWPCRNDPFSSYRAGFEVRAYRLCQRVLMFHHFPDEQDVGADCLVRSTDFTYSYEEDPTSAQNPIFSFLLSVSQSGYKRQQDRYVKKSLPPLEFEYTQPTIDETIREVDPKSLENLPYGLDGAHYQWVDLDGEGLSGILTEQAEAWFYKPNLSPINVHHEDGRETITARFGPVERVAQKPSLAAISRGRQQLLDLAGDGQLDLVELRGPTPGFYERTQDHGWETFAPFESLPVLDWDNPNLKFVDLTGDGHADIFVTEDEAFCWHPSLAEAGFGPRETLRQALDEEKGPKLVFADSTQSIYLADMSGDGLTDLVRIRNGEVCYWPNLGYGRFGTRVTMDNAPWFDRPDLFDELRIRLADIDGSGVTDILYVSHHGVQVYFNQSGNGWSTPTHLTGVPSTDNVKFIMVVDLLGNGTACLVWSSPLSSEVRQPMRYLDLMGGQKSHLLIKEINNLGAETHVQYAPSTKFYLADKLAGKTWVTRLPFPVHVVERVETLDRISGNRFVTRYAYHHGYFDGPEREFRGFGLVEQVDTEEFSALAASGTLPHATNIDEASHVPPVLTRTWFHTGAFLDQNRISKHFEHEYYREGDTSESLIGLTGEQLRALLLDDTFLPTTLRRVDGTRTPYTLATEEVLEACRALKGAILRQEVYALDGADEADRPYTTSERNYTIELLQPRDGNQHAVFFTDAREQVDFHYERMLMDVNGQKRADPRVSHTMTLEVDEFGNVLKSAAVGYGRRQPDMTLSAEDQAKQAQIFITYTENRVTNAIEAADDYRTPLPSESRTYEITGLTLPADPNRYTLAEMLAAGTGAAAIAYEQKPTAGVQKRLIEHVRTLYRPDDLGVAQNDPLALLPSGTVEPLALPGESYKLALTPGLLDQIYVRSGQKLLPANPADVLEGGGADRGGYVDLDDDGHWWIPSGRVFHSPNSGDTAAQELAHARQHFFLPHRYRDPFHTELVSTESVVNYDAYDLLLAETRDALDNRVTVGERDAAGNLTAPGNDYRVLQPRLMMDLNRNRTAVAFDALGMVVGTAVMGKPLPAPVEGDSLDGFEADLSEAVILDHLANPLVDPQAILRRATTRLVYDLFAYQRTKDQRDPQLAVVYTLVRETHDAGLAPGQQTKVQHSFSYSDGFGREIQKKIQAETGSVPRRDANGKIIVGAVGQPEMTPDDVSPRWVGSGWTVFSNKGKPVRQYEPFFTDTHRFEFDVRIGVSPVLFYDPLGRVVATLHPNRTWEKVVFDPWRQETWDVNDTVLVTDPKTDADVGDFFRRLPDADYLPTWHAQRKGGALGPQEQAAARKAAIHAETPAVAHADSLGRTFLTVAHNKFNYSATPAVDPPIEGFHCTRAILDIEGNQREVIDAKDRVVMRYEYDIARPKKDEDTASNRIHQASMEAGERWMLNDAAGKPLYAWDSRDHQFRTAYDALRRPTDTFLLEATGPERLIGRTIYGETRPNPETSNCRGKVIQLFDQAGVITSDDYDFKGNLLRGQRQLAKEYKSTLNWPTLSEEPTVPLEADSYTSCTRYDALNRPTELTTPHTPAMQPSVIRPSYNNASLLERVEANLRGARHNGQPVWTPFVTDIDYDAKGQRTLIDYGNGVTTTYEYDSLTLRLVHLLTRRNAVPGDCRQPPPTGWPGCDVQNLHYTYDPVGNITHIRDDAQQTIYFSNKRVEPSADYTYDAIYRLIEATGREHLGQAGTTPSPSSYNDKPRVGILFSGSDGTAMGRYLQRYVYDAVGNFKAMIHCGTDPTSPGWTRAYSYNESNLLEPTKESNRLSSTTIGATTETYSTDGDGYDAHGNMLRMPHLQIMRWDFRDQLQMTQRQALNTEDEEGPEHLGERTWYVYDAGGQRARKVTELATGQVKDERIYLGGLEIYRRQGVNPLVRETLHIMDDERRIALVETRTDTGAPEELIRYQFGNHLGSASLELDDQAQIISYEEYFPYGSTSYQAVRSGVEVTPKRYRYTGMERDEESGLEYHGARYYMPWLGRWMAIDPKGIEESANLYTFVVNNPIKLVDPDGAAPQRSNTKFMPPNRGDRGTFIHAIVLRTLSRRLDRIKIANQYEIETLPGGTKNIKTNHNGSVDLALFTKDPKKKNEYRADLYELKPHSPYDYQEYVSEVDHYTEYFPKKVGSYKVSEARIGTALEILEVVAPQLFDPIEIETSFAELTINIALAVDNNGDILPGVITYDVIAERRRSDKERSDVEKYHYADTSIWDVTLDILTITVVKAFSDAAQAAEAAKVAAAAEAAAAEAAAAEEAGGGFWATAGKTLSKAANRFSSFILVPGFVFKREGGGEIN